MKKITNCVNCGAPLHGCICEYCGTEYENEHMQIEPPKVVIEKRGIRNLRLAVKFDNYMFEGMSKREKEKIIKRQMALKFANELEDIIEVREDTQDFFDCYYGEKTYTGDLFVGDKYSMMR